MLVLVMSGLQIFTAAPYLDASDKSNPDRRIFSIDAHQDAAGKPVGTTTIFGRTFVTTHVLGYTDDGQGGESALAIPGALTLPAVQDLASGRTWHLFFAWMLTLSIVIYLIGAFLRKDLRELVLRPSDLPKLLPMQLYYLQLRKEPPPHGKYNPLQNVAYTVVLFGFTPLIIITGLALSPGIDAISGPLVWILGGRQFARTWNFTLMTILIAYFAIHMVLVFTTGPWNNVKSMINGWYRLKDHDGVGI